MGLKCGIVGLPNVGKSTLFGALTRLQVEIANYPFCTIEPNVGVVAIRDPRLDKLASHVGSQKATPNTLEIVDLAGLVKGASRGEGLGNKFLAKVREVDLLIHLIRGFEHKSVAHVLGLLDPVRDIEIIELELVLSDLEAVKRRQEKVKRKSKSGTKEYIKELAVLQRISDHLDKGLPVRLLSLTPEENRVVDNLNLLTAKKVLFVVNIDESKLGRIEEDTIVQQVEFEARKRGSPTLVVCAQLEKELNELSEEEEREQFLHEYGLYESGLDRLVRESYCLLGLITFFTVKGKESRAWTLRRGQRAVEAAGKVHSDMERGFISAEVIQWDQLLKTKSISEAREKGVIRLEGRDYVVQDGDVLFFRFNI